MSPSFHDALANAAAPLIAEIKPHSPKTGPLLAGRRVADIARDYAAAGVGCLSVTTGAWHGGDPAMIAEMAATGLPVLRKDFITSQRHLEESRAAGAAAVLLTCTLLRRADLVRLADAALCLGLTPFVEAASARELDGLSLPDGAILAINNRNIRGKETDDGGVEQSEELFSLARSRHAGLLVSASGFMKPSDVERAMAAGFDGVLVGTALLSGPDPVGMTVRRFLQATNSRAVPA
ncbi:indole-3-glycerol-phosphate synthase [Thalassococcus sp. CAU 1522]|uniref:Indole-3-glycerol-phosphate synthase n=1 Tax=Thalassococcus arenae TaxID=2851652 RepID=A0ABS6N2Z9_9RHOB|nr:indole-3-glycerol-phosphate synthase [Thalassococcus arenae]MBV2358168.1 indole-3-glycerol-phosphate synthase [Thalassococcus arenae]